MQQPEPRVREKTPEEASALADIDVRRKPEEFLREIYKEAYNSDQNGYDQVSKVMMKVSALFVRISADHGKIHSTIKRLTYVIAALTAVLVYKEISPVFHGSPQHEEQNHVSQNKQKSPVPIPQAQTSPAKAASN